MACWRRRRTALNSRPAFPNLMFPRKQSVPSQVVVEKSRHALRELAVVGVIPSLKRCGRDAGFRFDQPLNYPQLAGSNDCPAVDRYPPVRFGLPGACGLYAHLSQDKWRAVRSSGAKRPSTLARPSRRTARHTPARAGPRAAATGLGECVRSVAIETSVQLKPAIEPKGTKQAAARRPRSGRR